MREQLEFLTGDLRNLMECVSDSTCAIVKPRERVIAHYHGKGKYLELLGNVSLSRSEQVCSKLGELGYESFIERQSGYLDQIILVHSSQETMPYEDFRALRALLEVD